ncbi:RNA exonuclease 4-like isoform X2 [Malania oleifera]|uniref:RNA exonuclease 4-like isoform X2 n=2 Tax=Malania oleifera TaxID=397392 RepID=UPI0025AE6985|nr:RNA exonuclease 4-like isoform X2 [Malania oleifera]
MDDSQGNPPKTPATRHRCSACFKQYKKKEHLIEHMMASDHSVHQPKCGICEKHCKSFESLREHTTGPLSKAICSRIFANQGCDLCLKVFESPISLSKHKETCLLPAPVPIGTIIMPPTEPQIDFTGSANVNYSDRSLEAVAIDCEMVGCGSDGSLDLCARVCLIDEDEKLIFHTYVKPQIPVTNYRFEVTGIREEHLRDAMPLKEVQAKVLEILHNGESIGRLRLDGGKGRLLVGHGLEHDLDCLRMYYPPHMLRDTAKYHPLMKTNLVSHSLKYLTGTYLGQHHSPFQFQTLVSSVLLCCNWEHGAKSAKFLIQGFKSMFPSASFCALLFS